MNVQKFHLHPFSLLHHSFEENQFIEIAWTGNAEEYYAELFQGSESIMTQDWSQQTSYAIGYLTPGEYSITVIARNITGEAQSSMIFTVTESSYIRPETELNPLPINSNNSVIELTWDVNEGKNNVNHFEIQYRIGDGDWEFLYTDLGAEYTTALAILEAGYIYEFRMRAIAIKGLSEEFPVIPETSIEILSRCELELFILNDTMENATPIVIGETQVHTFCPANDVDWVQFPVDSTKGINISVDPLENKLPIIAQVYTPQNELSKTFYMFETKASIKIRPQPHQTGNWYILFQPYNPLVFGENTAYQVKSQQNLLTANIPNTIMLALGATAFIIILVVICGKKRKLW